MRFFFVITCLRFWHGKVCTSFYFFFPTSVVRIEKSSPRARLPIESSTATSWGLWGKIFGECDRICGATRIVFFITTMPPDTELFSFVSFLPKTTLYRSYRLPILQIYHLRTSISPSWKISVLTPLPRAKLNRRRSSTRLQKTTSRSDSKSSRKAGTGVFLWKVTISKEMMLKLR